MLNYRRVRLVLFCAPFNDQTWPAGKALRNGKLNGKIIEVHGRFRSNPCLISRAYGKLKDNRRLLMIGIDWIWTLTTADDYW